MSVICEKVPQSEVVKKAAYEGVTEFITVKRCEGPKDIPVGQKLSMDPCFMPVFYQNLGEKILDLEVQPDDIWVVGFPRSGTNWTQELVWLICNNLDYEGAAKVKLSHRYTHIEVTSLLSQDWPVDDPLTRLDSANRPRFIKSHLPAHLLPNQLWTVRPKIVYVARNTKDVAISCYHLFRNIHCYEGSYEDFMDVFLDNKIYFSPYHSHVKDFYDMRHEENILFLKYEDMKKDLPTVLRRVAEFLGKNYNEDQIQGLAEHLSFASIAKNPSVNQERALKAREEMTNQKRKDPTFKFIRKGEIGAFHDEMTPELIEKFNAWTQSEIKRLQCDPELKEFFNFVK